MKLFLVAFLLLLTTAHVVRAEYPMNYKVSFLSNVGSGDFAPYYMSSNVHGVLTQPQSALLRGGIERKISKKERFSYGFGLDMIGGYASKTTYSVYSLPDKTFRENKQGPSWGWIQQLYGEVKYRSLFLCVGMKERSSALFNTLLGSGDFVESGNARPMPTVRLGFIDFQNIPFTKGWLQVQGELGYGRQLDGKWMENHYNYYTGFINTNTWYNYKRIYFRTKPTKRFHITIGMQAAAQFGGHYRKYEGRILTEDESFKLGIKDFIKVLIPPSGAGNSMLRNDGYYTGNHLGSWDFVAQYRLKNNDIVKAYFQFPWEDGSGIGKMNGWDGTWGMEYQSARKGYLHGVVLEYIDFTNQGGPMHWAPNDYPENVKDKLPNHATGADNYYNNYMYNGYQYYGMSIGTPFAKSPIYNKNGSLQFSDTRVRGFQVGITGYILPTFQYRLLTSYRTSLGTPFFPSFQENNNTSFLIEGIYSSLRLSGFILKGQFAFDKGNLYGDNFGGSLSVIYMGNFKF